MSEIQSPGGLELLEAPSRKSRIETYLWDEADEVSFTIAEDFYNPDKPINSYGVLIPVAAHQEAGSIAHSMAEYAKQEGNDPFTVFLLLNAPSGSDANRVNACINEVKAAQAAYPHLDIRFSVNDYQEPIIGQIRKDLWDAVARVALADGLYEQPGNEFIGINHDIDTVSIGPHYVRNIQRHYRSLQRELEAEGLSEIPLPLRHTQVKHAYPFDTHPNVARAVFWDDFTYRQGYRNGIYEEGLVVPLSYYAQQKGFDPQATTHETRRLTHLRVAEGIPRTPMSTSPRRFVDRIGQGHKAIWTLDSFTATDACRDPQTLPADISHAELETRIAESLQGDLGLFCAGIPSDRWDRLRNKLERTTFFNDEAAEVDKKAVAESVFLEVQTRLHLASQVLDRVIGSKLLASMVDEPVIQGFAKRHTDKLYLQAGLRLSR